MKGIPTWSPRSDRIATLEGSKLATAALAGGPERIVARAASGFDLWWLRGDALFFNTQFAGRDAIETQPENGGARIILHTATGFERDQLPVYTMVSWSPNGTRLAFARRVQGGSVLRVAAADGSGAHTVARNPTGVPPAWSPAGKKLVYTTAHGLWLVGARGGHARRLAPAGATDPEWSPDGQRIAYRFYGELYVVKPDGRSRTAVASDVTDPPSWSPGGQRIAFSTNSTGTVIETISADGRGNKTLISAPPGDDQTGALVFHPVWSPDGRQILYSEEHYVCGEDCSYVDLHLIHPDGSHARKLPFVLGDATWSPDGTLLIGQAGHVKAIDLQTGKTRFDSGDTVVNAWSWQPLPRR